MWCYPEMCDYWKDYVIEEKSISLPGVKNPPTQAVQTVPGKAETTNGCWASASEEPWACTAPESRQRGAGSSHAASREHSPTGRDPRWGPAGGTHGYLGVLCVCFLQFCCCYLLVDLGVLMGCPWTSWENRRVHNGCELGRRGDEAAGTGSQTACSHSHTLWDQVLAAAARVTNHQSLLAISGAQGGCSRVLHRVTSPHPTLASVRFVLGATGWVQQTPATLPELFCGWGWRAKSHFHSLVRLCDGSAVSQWRSKGRRALAEIIFCRINVWYSERALKQGMLSEVWQIR